MAFGSFSAKLIVHTADGEDTCRKVGLNVQWMHGCKEEVNDIICNFEHKSVTS